MSCMVSGRYSEKLEAVTPVLRYIVFIIGFRLDTNNITFVDSVLN